MTSAEGLRPVTSPNNLEDRNPLSPEGSAFLTTVARALDSRLPGSVLRDLWADRIVVDLDYDITTFPVLSDNLRDPRNKVFEIATRAQRIDEIVDRFTARESAPVVVDLGAGVDTRRLRLGSTAAWYDVDLPAVSALRRRLFAPAPQAQVITADLRDDHSWIDRIPRRPAIMVADGLIPFLSEEMVVALLRRLTTHFPHGELAFNAYTPAAVFALRRLGLVGSIDADVLLNPGFFDPRTPEGWGAGLRLLEEIAIARAPEVSRLPAPNRQVHRLAGRSRGVSRFVATTVLHYGF